MTAPVLLTPIQIIRGSNGAYILITSTPGSTLTCGADTYTLGSAETSHAFEVVAGTYACSASLSGYTTATQNVTVSGGVTEISLRPYLIPTEYQQVKWLMGDDRAYINSMALGVVSSDKLKIGVITNILRGYNYQTGVCVFGTNNNFQIFYWVGTVSVGNANASFNFVSGESYEFEVTGNTLYVDGTTTGLTRGAVSGSNSLFSNGGTNTSAATIQYVKKYDSSDNLVLNWLPCYRKADSVPGFYDTVNNNFITRTSNNGAFICGEDVN